MSRPGRKMTWLAEPSAMTSTSDPIASPAPDTIVKLRGLTPKNVKMRGPTPKRGVPLQVAGASRDRPSAGRLAPQRWGKCPDPGRNGVGANSEWRTASGEDASGSSSSHSPLTIRHSPFATRGSVTTLACGARAPQVPPWASPCSCSRLPPAGADATAEDGRITAGRTGGTGDDDVKQRSDCFSDTGFEFELLKCGAPPSISLLVRLLGLLVVDYWSSMSSVSNGRSSLEHHFHGARRQRTHQGGYPTIQCRSRSIVLYIRILPTTRRMRDHAQKGSHGP